MPIQPKKPNMPTIKISLTRKVYERDYERPTACYYTYNVLVFCMVLCIVVALVLENYRVHDIAVPLLFISCGFAFMAVLSRPLPYEKVLPLS